MEFRITDSMEFHGKSHVRSIPFHSIYSMEFHLPYSMERNPRLKSLCKRLKMLKILTVRAPEISCWSDHWNISLCMIEKIYLTSKYIILHIHCSGCEIQIDYSECVTTFLVFWLKKLDTIKLVQGATVLPYYSPTARYETR